MERHRGDQTVRLQGRDFAVLRCLFESRVMTLSHITTLFFEGHKEAAKKRMQALKCAGLVAERPRRPFDPSILSLTEAGLRALEDGNCLSDCPPQLIDARKLNHCKVSDLTLRHELAVMDVRASMAAAVANAQKLEVVEFVTVPQLNAFTSSDAEGKIVTTKPDGFMRISELCRDGKTAVHSFFLEVDRGTEALEVLTRKASCYAAFYRSGGFATRNGRPPEKFKSLPFRVLMAFKSDERRNNVAESLLRMKSPILRQVWLTSIAAVLADPLRPIWVRPVDYRDALQGTRFQVAVGRGQLHRRDTERETTVESRVQKQMLFL